MSSWNPPKQFLRHAFNDPVGYRKQQKTATRQGSEEAKEGGETVLKCATIMREISAFHPRNLGGFSVVYTNRPEGKSLTSLVFKLFGSLPWEGVSAKVAIGCSPLIEGLLQIQLPRIHNQDI